MTSSPVVSIVADSDLARAGLARVVARAGLELADPHDAGDILLRLGRSESEVDTSSEMSAGDPDAPYLAELVVIGEGVKLRFRTPTTSMVTAAVDRLLQQIAAV